jgi:two-component system response regulator PilR (NtrC family)
MSPRPKVLIVDDEPDIRELLEITLGRMKLDTYCARNAGEALALLQREPFDLCLTDMRLPDGSGLELVQHIQQHYPQVPVAMITAFGSLDTAINALKAGAFDFLTKPVVLTRLRELVTSALLLPVPGSAIDRRLLGESPPMRDLRKQIEKLARSQAPVYISGESGSGKELVARLIHERGPRASQPFKLLRAIQEKAVRSVGGQQEVVVDVRILCATHKDLGAEVAAERFRQDLYYRLNVIELRVPPLRERRDDIEPLASHMLKRLAADSGQPAAKLHPNALDTLKNYRFPGNVRELENMLERAHTLCENKLIEASDLRLAEGNCAAEGGAPDLTQIDNLEAYLENVERQLLLQALEETRWNRTAAAQRLNLSFRSMRYRLKKLGLD